MPNPTACSPSSALQPVTIANIDPGDPARSWVHSNWFWHQQSLDNAAVTFPPRWVTRLSSRWGCRCCSAMSGSAFGRCWA